MAPIVALLNMRVPPFDDLRARRAIGGYGIDRQKIARLAIDGRVSPLVSILPVGVPGAIDLNTLYPYDPEKARGLLKELGFHAQNPLKVTMLVPNHEMVLVDVAALLADQLAKISVQTKIVLVDAVAWVDRVIAGHDFEMVVSNWSSLLDINMRSVSFFKGGASNYTGIDDSRLEAMTRQWRRSLSADERERLSADMQRLIADQLYWINVTGYPFFQAYHSYVHDYPFFNQTYMFLERVWIEP
jgi:peptide/nickel transport system substrate-binding protein